MPRAGPKKVDRYSLEFKLTAVRLSEQPGIQVKAVAAALDIHPFMLSRWRKQVRDGELRGRGRDVRVPPPSEIRRLQELERAHVLLQEEHELLKSHPVLFRSKQEIFAFIASQTDRFSVTRLCDLYGVTRAGYYAWKRRAESAHAEQDRKLTEHITSLFHMHHGRYGSRRIHRELRQEGCRVSRRRVERLIAPRDCAHGSLESIAPIRRCTASMANIQTASKGKSCAAKRDLGGRCHVSARRPPVALSRSGARSMLTSDSRMAPGTPSQLPFDMQRAGCCRTPPTP
jgi:transposase